MTRISARGLILLLLVVNISACSKNIIAPSFNLAGQWSGSWTDPTIIDQQARSPTGDFQLIIEEDGTGSGFGEITFGVGSNITSDELSLEVEVFVDGAVHGTGTHTVTYPDQTNSLIGDVVGQLDVRKLQGYGVLRISIEGLPFNIEWHVEISK